MKWATHLEEIHHHPFPYKEFGITGRKGKSNSLFLSSFHTSSKHQITIQMSVNGLTIQLHRNFPLEVPLFYLCSSSWLFLFPTCSTSHLPVLSNTHCPLIENSSFLEGREDSFHVYYVLGSSYVSWMAS